jgi:hypothetical protein
MRSAKPRRKTQAEKLSTRAAALISELGNLLDSPDPATADDAKQYLMGLANCIHFVLDMRGLAAVKVYEKYNTNGGAK